MGKLDKVFFSKDMQNAPEIKQENINRFLCRNCGANMVFDAKTGQLACMYCAYSEEIRAGDSVLERSLDEFLWRAGQNLQPMAQNAMQARCESCGATVNFTPPETARSCDFCGAKIVAQPKSADPLMAPEGVLPFSVPPPQAAANFNRWLASLWFAPSALKIMAAADKFSSIYIPYWTYAAFSSSRYSGERGEHYYETETFYENGEQKQRQVRKTRWSGVSGSVSRQFDDVCIPATKSLPQQYLDRLEPWDLNELKSYEPAFLSGHKAQIYQVTLEEGLENFKQIASGVIYNDVRHDIGGDEQRVHQVSTDYSRVTFKHLLLPIYAGAYRFNGRVFQIVINGRTGEVQGERPYSPLKITAFVLALLAFVSLILLVLSLVR